MGNVVVPQKKKKRNLLVINFLPFVIAWASSYLVIEITFFPYFVIAREKARSGPLRNKKRRDKSNTFTEARWIAASVTMFPPRNDKDE